MDHSGRTGFNQQILLHLFSFILAFFTWFDTKEIKKSLLLFLIGMIVVLVFLLILYGFGYYG